MPMQTRIPAESLSPRVAVPGNGGTRQSSPVAVAVLACDSPTVACGSRRAKKPVATGDGRNRGGKLALRDPG